MLAQRKTMLDVFQCHEHYLGIFRDTFTRVSDLSGVTLVPVEGSTVVWNFVNAAGGMRGRMIDVEGALHNQPIALNSQVRAYMITRQDFTLALLLSGSPWRLNLNDVRYKVVAPGKKPMFPPQWPEGAITQVIRHRLRNILVLDEVFWLQKIGLRAGN
ncbi:MAG: hypothetical protein OEZ59_03000 [Deltaproteobacteria bacterium]|nr:hypothetical protein [Deltaproteobacteria bacterium]